ncbi:hypothetical protein B1R29_34770, partial [Pseudomonas aeruginosa]
RPAASPRRPRTVLAQALLLARGAALRASDGSALALEAQTLCVHGDNPASLAAVRRIRDALEAA